MSSGSGPSPTATNGDFDQNADFEDIDDATAASYTPVGADNAMWLRAATATYTDPEGSDTAMSDPQEKGLVRWR